MSAPCQRWLSNAMKHREYERELKAAALVAGSFAGRIERGDIRGSRKANDWNILLPDDRILALEVTSTTDPRVASQWREINRHVWTVPKSRWGWSIAVNGSHGSSRGSDLRKCREAITKYLPTLEEHGIRTFGSHVPMPKHPKAQEAFRGLLKAELVQGSSSGIPPLGVPPQVSIGTSTISPKKSGIDGFNSLLETIILANLEKLFKSKAHNRHLFVWGDRTDQIAFPDMALGRECPRNGVSGLKR
jgi:hypothetical protein